MCACVCEHPILSLDDYLQVSNFQVIFTNTGNTILLIPIYIFRKPLIYISVPSEKFSDKCSALSRWKEYPAGQHVSCQCSSCISNDESSHRMIVCLIVFLFLYACFSSVSACTTVIGHCSRVRVLKVLKKMHTINALKNTNRVLCRTSKWIRHISNVIHYHLV